MKVCSVQEIRRLDLRAGEEYGLQGEILMENAGHAVYSVISRDVVVRGGRFAVFGGPGNNGGDGFVVARKLRSSGGGVRALVLGKAGSYVGPARRNLQRLRKAGVEIRFRPAMDEILESLGWCDAVVDGLLGTGITRDVTSPFREVVEAVNRSGKPVFSIDIPSGVDGDTGEVHGVAIRAGATVTFGLPKRGNVLGPGAALGGRLFVSHISFPPALVAEAVSDLALNNPSEILEAFEDGAPGEGALLRLRRAVAGLDTNDRRPPGHDLPFPVRIVGVTELAREAGQAPEEMRRRSLDFVRSWTQERSEGIILLGAPTLLAAPAGPLFLEPGLTSRQPPPEGRRALGAVLSILTEVGLPLEMAMRTATFLLSATISAQGRPRTPPGGRRVLLRQLLATTRSFAQDPRAIRVSHLGFPEVV